MPPAAAAYFFQESSALLNGSESELSWSRSSQKGSTREPAETPMSPSSTTFREQQQQQQERRLRTV